MDLGAFRGQFGKVGFLEKLGNGIAPALDFNDRFWKFTLPEKNRRLGSRVHHQHVRPKLLEGPGELVSLGVSIDKIEELQVALSIADDAVEIVNLKQTQIAVVILNPFLLELGALFRGERVILTAGLRARGAELMIREKGFATVRPHTVGPAAQFHLKHAEINPELQFLAAIEAENF